LETSNQLLEKRLHKIATKNEKRIRSIKKSVDTQASRINFNGFVSAMATKNNKNVDIQFEGTVIDER